MFKIALSLTLISLLSCQPNDTGDFPISETMQSYRSGKVSKTLERILTKRLYSDSIVSLHYKTIADQNTFLEEYHLPIKGKLVHQYPYRHKRDIKISLLDSSVVTLNSKSSAIYKYKYDLLDSYDEERLLYYISGAGIVKVENYVWLNHRQVIISPLFTDEELILINKTIESNLKPFSPWPKGHKHPSSKVKEKSNIVKQ